MIAEVYVQVLASLIREIDPSCIYSSAIHISSKYHISKYLNVINLNIQIPHNLKNDKSPFEMWSEYNEPYKPSKKFDRKSCSLG